MFEYQGDRLRHGRKLSAHGLRNRSTCGRNHLAAIPGNVPSQHLGIELVNIFDGHLDADAVGWVSRCEPVLQTVGDWVVRPRVWVVGFVGVERLVASAQLGE